MPCFDQKKLIRYTPKMFFEENINHKIYFKGQFHEIWGFFNGYT
jgi:hypothetical protein